jgi:aryl-alcohol dehydrogenase-like predicted oxidoreductase
MKYVERGGARLSAVGLGTWQFGSGEWGYGKAYAADTAPAIVARSLDLGVNLFDSAEVYASGRSERILGAALAGRRSEAFVATKLLPLVPVDPVVAWRARKSLSRLATDALDLYQLHWPNPVVPLRRTMAAMGKLQEEGLVHHIGVSNFSLTQWQDAEACLGAPVLSNQVRYSLLDRSCERTILPWAQANGRIVMAYSPLAQGVLSGRYDPGHPPSGLRSATTAFLPENLRRAEPLLGTLREVAAAHGASCAQIALAWLVHQPGVVVIPGASSVAQAEANAASADLSLSDTELAALRAAADAYRPLAARAALPALARARVQRVKERIHQTSEGLRA